MHDMLECLCRRSHNFAEQQYSHLLCISPDAPTNPVLYWLGNMSSNPTRFLLEGAKGPLHLDLGDVLYAPNLMIDSEVSLHTLHVTEIETFRCLDLKTTELV